MTSEILTPEQRFALLRRTLKWAEEKTDFYRTAFAEAGVGHASVKSFADMARLPFWEDAVKEEGADAPFFMLTLPLSGILRMSVLSDGEGKSRIYCYTQGDAARHVQTAADILRSCGVNRASMVLLCGDFTDSRTLDLQYALEMIGAAVLPCENRNSAAVRRFLQAAVPDTVIVWEQALPVLAEAMDDLCVSRVITVGRHIAPEGGGRQAAVRMGRRHTHIFTRAELGALIGCSCADGRAVHVEERLFFAEVVDQAGRSMTADGAAGELVLSTIAAEAMPVLRCRTGLHVRLARGTCACGSGQLCIMEE